MAGFKTDMTEQVGGTGASAGFAMRKKGVSPNSTDALYDKGVDLIEDELAQGADPSMYGRDSGTLHFVTALGRAEKSNWRRTEGGTRVKTFGVVGAVFKSDKDIDVPDIPVTCNQKTGVPPEMMGTRRVKAGEEFQCTLIEYMFLITRIEYSGFCEYGGDPQFVSFSPKVQNFLTEGANSQKLPTPTITFRSGSPKEFMVPIDKQVANGKWVCLPEYEEKFGALWTKRNTPKEVPSKTIARPVGITAALRKMLEVDGK